jgi:hypothetical protein
MCWCGSVDEPGPLIEKGTDSNLSKTIQILGKKYPGRGGHRNEPPRNVEKRLQEIKMADELDPTSWMLLCLGGVSRQERLELGNTRFHECFKTTPTHFTNRSLNLI